MACSSSDETSAARVEALEAFGGGGGGGGKGGGGVGSPFANRRFQCSSARLMTLSTLSSSR